MNSTCLEKDVRLMTYTNEVKSSNQSIVYNQIHFNRKDHIEKIQYW